MVFTLASLSGCCCGDFDNSFAGNRTTCGTGLSESFERWFQADIHRGESIRFHLGRQTSQLRQRHRATPKPDAPVDRTALRFAVHNTMLVEFGEIDRVVSKANGISVFKPPLNVRYSTIVIVWRNV